VKFTLSWLREHLDTQATLGAITDTLTRIGLEVEAVHDPAAALAPFVTALVIEAVQHPNADRLRVCRVSLGAGPAIQVVCGAPNARTGMAAVFAPPGALIPATGITLKTGEIRGVQSAGMLVSQRELGLGEDHDGIIELPEGTEPGQAYAAFAGLDDPLVEIGVTPNRGDALGVRGIARDLAAAGLGRLRPWPAGPALAPSRVFCPIAWRIEAPEACSWVLGRQIARVRNPASPDWLARRLTAVGLRPISALVDVTNFFVHDLGRPLHVFDADRIAGGTLTVRRGRAGETFFGLDDRNYDVTDQDIVIADASGVISLAGIMGGKSTAVSERTRNVFVECALFDPVMIALSGRRHQIRTDARARFERGVDQALPPAALNAATQMIVSLCGGEPSETNQAGAEPAWRRNATMRFDRLSALAGTPIAADEAVATLNRLGFATHFRGPDHVVVAVPSWRNDVAGNTKLDQTGMADHPRALRAAEGAALIEPEADLIEEVLRIQGLDTIPPLSLPAMLPVPAATLTPRQTRTALARRLLASRGMAECVGFSFMKQEDAALFGGGGDALRVVNPIAADLDQMRPTPLATLVHAARRNAARGLPDLALFEIGAGYGETGQALMAAGLRTGVSARHWSRPAAPVGAMDAKADLLALLAAVGMPMEALTTAAEPPGWYHPGRAGLIKQGPKTILARFGELHPSLQARLGLSGAAVAFELFLDQIPDPKRRRRAAPELSAFQPVRRDFAFLIPAGMPAENLLRTVRGADRALIAQASLFDVYEGDKIEPSMKSIGIEIVLQPREKTLTDAEIEAVSARIVHAATKIGASLR
jgi:phenylalanyl-tRNA synthetase beta chain